VVLDTQTLLDWQFFGNPGCAAWCPPNACTWRWLATAAMRDELAHVLARGFPARWQTPAEHVLAFFDAHATLVEPPPAVSAGALALRCTDPDDQKFIDLAFALRPAMLVSRDRAVLKLARRAAAHGVAIVPPQRWHLTATAAAMPP
jgi:uncharacterized protein